MAYSRYDKRQPTWDDVENAYQRGRGYRPGGRPPRGPRRPTRRYY